MTGTREEILSRLKQDLIGPESPDEVIRDRPTDRYLTGILFPPRTEIAPEEDDDAVTADEEDNASTATDAIAAANASRPNVAGISLAVKAVDGEIAAISIEIHAGRYAAVEQEGKTDAERKHESEEDGRSGTIEWHRTPLEVLLTDVPLEADSTEDIDLTPYGIVNASLHIRTSEWNGALLVTLAVSNTAEVIVSSNLRRRMEEASLFQFEMRVYATSGTRFVPKPAMHSVADDDARSASLIYRDVSEFAVGHTCSAGWLHMDKSVACIHTSWVPTALVPSTSPDGDAVFQTLRTHEELMPLEARWISECEAEKLVEGLSLLTDAYARWMEGCSARVELLEQPHLLAQARQHMQLCNDALERMRRGISFLASNHDAMAAFRMANRAMLIQRSWSGGGDLEWRPFQLGFALLTLVSVASAEEPDREIMDLLWFPTGGGKTEAYLLITAFAIFFRRIRAGGDESGAGVTVFMRYTLRLLTIQQYQRAAAVICACEQIRMGRAHPGRQPIPGHFQGDDRISLGLWVGQDSTPNTVKKAVTALAAGDTGSSPVQITECPACHNHLSWTASPANDQIWARCTSSNCELNGPEGHLPVWTVDEDVYRAKPSLLIGTVDKYAQIARNPDTALLFGIGTRCSPPDLVIQDELHLISGPLGTLTGIYEIAVDELCSWQGARPKVIGSTATIRRAADQIRALFDRTAFQFPPPGLDASNSGFAVEDPDAPGRLYAGVTTAGRSAKFTLQAVSASLLQAATDPRLSDAERDPYWTLVTYFNSLRELGGALVLMQDDVTKSIDDYANRRSEDARQPMYQVELTSRVQSSDIPELLQHLSRECTNADSVDIALASNMISVGVDIPRLGLMLVNGQPKGMAEYIQATSRVGRGAVPGLVMTLYNANKARDRSHYETFCGWHQSLYRDVEATSVTPFAPRARERAIHAAFVAMARHLIDGMRSEPVRAMDHEHELRGLVDRIVERARRVDPDEADEVRQHLGQLLDDWLARGEIRQYWDDWKFNGLMLSAEKAAELAAAKRYIGSAWPTPNSLRSVEASSEFVVRPILTESNQ